MNIKGIMLFLAVLAAEGTVGAQDKAGTQSAPRLRWDVRFDTKFDNREYDNLQYLDGLPSKTYFSARVAPAIGLGFGKEGRHRLMAGLSYTRDFGVVSAREPNPEGLFFYNYRTAEYGAWVGAFERRHLTGTYSRAIYAGSNVFYDNVIEGFALQYKGRDGSGRTRLELVFDWDGEQSATERESFRVLSAGEFNPVESGAWRWLTMGYSLDMYHLATRKDMPDDGVVDHMLLDAYAGAALERIAPWFEKLTVKAGWTNAFDRDRDASAGSMTPGGATLEVAAQKWGVGVRNFTYSGALLMPLYAAYGSRINRGDPFFISSKRFNATTVYWHPKITEGVTLRFEATIPTDGRHIGSQQVCWIGVSLDDGMFRKNR
jgi:hypothetical protein